MSQKIWSTEEVQKLKLCDNKKTLSEASEMLDRSKNSVKRKAERLGIKFIKEVNTWNKKEEEFLIRALSRNLSYSDIAKKLKRTVKSVKHKAYNLDIQEKSKSTNREWTFEEERYLENYYEKRDINYIAKKMKRSKSSIKDKAYKMGLCQYSSMLSMRELSRCFSSDVSVVKRWVSKFDLPCHEREHGERIYYHIDIEEFWKWAENHKDMIPWSKYEDMSLIPQPDFVNEYISNSKKLTEHRSPITDDMVRSVGALYYIHNKSIEELCNEYKRTQHSIKHILRKYDELINLK